MRKFIAFWISLLLVLVQATCFSQSSGQKPDPENINERVSNLEKGQAGLKVRSNEINHNLTDQKLMADSVCRRVKEMETDLMARTDSIKSRMNTLDQIQQDITSMQKKISNRRVFSLSSSIVVALLFLLLIIIILIQYRRIKRLKGVLEETQNLMDEKLSEMKDSYLAVQNSINTLNLEVSENKSREVKDFNILEDKFLNLQGLQQSASADLRSLVEKTDTELKELFTQKLNISGDETARKIDQLAAMVAAIEKSVEGKGKKE